MNANQLVRGPLRTGRHIMGGAILAILTLCVDGMGPSCNYCLSGTGEPSYPPSAFGYTGATPFSAFIQHIAMNWVGIQGSPAVNNPALVCAPNFKQMLLNRNDRASTYILCPQAWIILRSGAGSSSNPNFKIMIHPTPAGAVTGDLEIDDTVLANTFLQAERLYGNTAPKGIIALNVHHLVDGMGHPVLRGVSICPADSMTKPWLAVEDPTVECPLNERSLAHEIGHQLGLCHDAPPAGCTCPGSVPLINLMASGQNGANLTFGDAMSMRTFWTNKSVLDPPGVPGTPQSRIDVLFDDTTNSPALPGFLDISKILVVDGTTEAKDLSLYLALEGVIPTNQLNVKYWILLDSDNNAATGSSPTGLVPGNPIDGVDFIAEVMRENDELIMQTLYYSDNSGTLTVVPLDQDEISVRLRAISFAFCNPIGAYSLPASAPFATELEFRIANSALVSTNLASTFGRGLFTGGGNLFTNGLRIQAVSSALGIPDVDRAPENGGVMQFTPPYNPTVTHPLSIALGENVTVDVQGITALAPLELRLAGTNVPISAISDADGTATVSFVVPSDLPIGPTLITIGVADPGNASTAESVIEITDPSAPLTLTISSSGLVLTLEWNSMIAVLQETPDVTGPWTSISEARSPWEITLSDQNRFYRVKK